MKNKEFYKAFNSGWNKLFDELLLELEPFYARILDGQL